MFHGPKEEVVPFFQSMGFYVPERKAVSDFLQEVTSPKDQAVRLLNICGHIKIYRSTPVHKEG